MGLTTIADELLTTGDEAEGVTEESKSVALVVCSNGSVLEFLAG